FGSVVDGEGGVTEVAGSGRRAADGDGAAAERRGQAGWQAGDAEPAVRGDTAGDGAGTAEAGLVGRPGRGREGAQDRAGAGEHLADDVVTVVSVEEVAATVHRHPVATPQGGGGGRA